MVWKGWIIVSEYRDGWNDGFAAGCSQGDSANRISAFGAIRRAAEIAREEDRRAIERRDIYKDPVLAAVCQVQASAIRFAIRAAIQEDDIGRAIRAAIGSDKL